MARRRNIERLYRKNGSLCMQEGRRDYVLILTPNEEMAKVRDEFGDFCINHVKCVEKCIEEAIRYYGFFKKEDIEHIKAMKIGETWNADDNSIIIRVA